MYFPPPLPFCVSHILVFLHLTVTQTTSDEEYKSCHFLQHPVMFSFLGQIFSAPCSQTFLIYVLKYAFFKFKFLNFILIVIGIYLCMYRPIHPPTYLSIYLFIYLPICFSVCVSTYLSVFLSIYLPSSSPLSPFFYIIFLSFCTLLADMWMWNGSWPEKYLNRLYLYLRFHLNNFYIN
jgi:hypothetical protein